jgi:hypothetical protein
MRKRISRISVLQTASMFGVLYAILGLVWTRSAAFAPSGPLTCVWPERT